MAADPQLAASDVRALLRLLGELRELGAHPPRWRQHLVQTLTRLCGTRACLAGELTVAPPPDARQEDAGLGRDTVTLVHREEQGVGAHDLECFEREVVWNTHGPNEAISGSWPAYALRFSATRAQLVEDRRWYRTGLANDRFRAQDCDDFIVSMVPVPALRVLTSIKLFRGWRDRRFGPREQALVELLSEELARDWTSVGADSGPALAPRLRQVLGLLAAGASEKEVAAALRISPSTVHDYAKALHRIFGVHSRSELLARQARPERPRTHLVSEGSAADHANRRSSR
jgi:DNA-binding CsgD family transcriptional regulator